MKRKLTLCWVALLCMAAVTSAQQTLYVSPTGSASNPGTSISAPTTLQNAIATVTAGGTIYLRGGTYSLSQTIVIAEANSGSSGATKKLFAYSGEVPVLSFTGMAVSSSNRGIVLDGSYWHFRGIIVEGAGDNGILLSGDNNTIESCIFRRNADTGLQLSRYNSAYTTISQWPSNNLILNCEAYDNRDPTNENADGFAAKLTCGNGNVFRNCVAHHNIDDGWDLYTKPDTGPIGTILLEGCIAHSNGVLTTGGTSGSGDKNGFKLGGEDISVNHIVRRCIAFNNGKHGFTYNRNLGSIEVTNNTAYNNAERNFNFDGGTSVFKNNLSYLGGSSTDRIIGTATAPNAFQGLASSFTINAADFVSLTPGANANPTAGGFLNLAAGSDAINSGVTSSGITYSGAAPDLGAIESGSTATSYTLTTAASPAAGGSITRSPNASTYASGTVVTLTAVPASGYTFTGWSGGASGTNATTTVTMNSNLSVTASFTTGTGTTYTLTTIASPSAGGSITRSPNASSYAAGTVVTLIAVPASGYSFSGWSGAASGTSTTTTVTMNANLSVTAGFTSSPGGTTLRIDDKSGTGTGYCAANGSRQNTYSGADGGYYINLSNSSGQGIDWAVKAGAAGTYTLRWRYANAGSSSATTARVLVNGAQAVASVAFPKTAAWTTWTTTTTTVTLVTGANKIRLETTVASEFANIDWIEITGNNPTEASCSAAVGSARSQGVIVQEQPDLTDAVTIFPNPAAKETTVRIQNTTAQKITVALQDANGRQVQQVFNGLLPAGVQTLPLNCTQLRSGLYRVVVALKDGEVISRPLYITN